MSKQKIVNYLSLSGRYMPVTGTGYSPIMTGGSSIGMTPFIAWERNTGESKNMSAELSLSMQDPFENNRQFIKLVQSFKQELKKFSEVFQGNKYILDEKMKVSAGAILNYSPDKVSLQLTDEGSIFYTFLRGEITVYFQHFIIDDCNNCDETILSIFKGNENLLNYAGSLIDAITELNTIFLPQTFGVTELA